MEKGAKDKETKAERTKERKKDMRTRIAGFSRGR